jgi:hypothetical protein
MHRISARDPDLNRHEREHIFEAMNRRFQEEAAQEMDELAGLSGRIAGFSVDGFGDQDGSFTTEMELCKDK